MNTNTWGRKVDKHLFVKSSPPDTTSSYFTSLLHGLVEPITPNLLLSPSGPPGSNATYNAFPQHCFADWREYQSVTLFEIVGYPLTNLLLLALSTVWWFKIVRGFLKVVGTVLSGGDASGAAKAKKEEKKKQ